MVCLLHSFSSLYFKNYFFRGETYHSVCVKAGGELAGVSYLLPPQGSLDWTPVVSLGSKLLYHLLALYLIFSRKVCTWHPKPLVLGVQMHATMSGFYDECWKSEFRPIASTLSSHIPHQLYIVCRWYPDWLVWPSRLCTVWCEPTCQLCLSSISLIPHSRHRSSLEFHLEHLPSWVHSLFYNNLVLKLFTHLHRS